jgi:hypothetical protein
MLTRLGALAFLAAALSQAAVDRISVKEKTDLAGGVAFGDVGPYERIIATAHFLIDPKLPQNRGIIDLELAPRNKDGMVEFSADLLVLKPRDPSKGNGTAIVDVPNRGRLLSVSMFNRAPSALDPKSVAELGDGLLMRQGFSVVSVGWQWDEPAIPGRLGLHAPQLPGITGLVRGEFVPDKSVSRFSLGDRDHVPYPVADQADSANRLYVRQAPGVPRREIPRSKWRFVDKGSIEVDGGCEPGLIYEVVYRATGAVPTGLGFAAVRDMASFLKYGESPLLAGGKQQHIKRTIGFGVSQTGRFLRHMVYEGFNQDEKNRKALDGVWAEVAGAGRGGFNHRFAQPSRDGQPLLHYSWPVDMFPFTDAKIDDPLTGRSDGLLTRVQALQVAPRIFYTNHSYEYWGRAASLIHTTTDSRRDIPPGNDTRIYFLAGGQHGSGSLPLKRTNTENVDNPLDIRWAMRGLLIAFHEWLKDGVEPPSSLYPKIAAGELVRSREVKYPANVHAPRWPRVPQVLDFGPDFAARKIVTVEPPKEGSAYPILVPQVDRDGNEVGGLRLPELEAPLGIYTGWNLRGRSIGSPDRMIAFTGSFFPYDSAKIRQRYGSREAYLKQFRQSGQKLSARRLILASDLPQMVERAGQLWDEVIASRQALP